LGSSPAGHQDFDFFLNSESKEKMALEPTKKAIISTGHHIIAGHEATNF